MREITPDDLVWIGGVVRHAQRRIPATWTYEDLFGGAQLGLVEAAIKYDPARGTPWKAFAKKYVHGHIFMLTRRRHWKEHHHAQLDPVTHGNHAVVEVKDEDPELSAILAMQGLTPRSRVLLLAEAKRIPWKDAAIALQKPTMQCRALARVAVLEAKALTWRQLTGHDATTGFTARRRLQTPKP